SGPLRQAIQRLQRACQMPKPAAFGSEELSGYGLQPEDSLTSWCPESSDDRRMRIGFHSVEVVDDLTRIVGKQPVAGPLENDVQQPPLRAALEVPLPCHLDPAATGVRCRLEFPP